MIQIIQISSVATLKVVRSSSGNRLSVRCVSWIIRIRDIPYLKYLNHIVGIDYLSEVWYQVELYEWHVPGVWEEGASVHVSSCRGRRTSPRVHHVAVRTHPLSPTPAARAAWCARCCNHCLFSIFSTCEVPLVYIPGTVSIVDVSISSPVVLGTQNFDALGDRFEYCWGNRLPPRNIRAAVSM